MITEILDVEGSDHSNPQHRPLSSSLVAVLLSTRNGERYVEPQLASILSQTHPAVRVEVRDDESTDDTLDLVQAISREDCRLRATRGPRLGPAASFMTLLASSRDDARWFAFSDQDDVWLPDKLSRAVAALEPLDDRPALYGSSMLHVDDALFPIAPTPTPRQVCFHNALVQNVLPGCTMVFNRAARALALAVAPERIPTHDWWLYLVVAAFGTVVFDDAVTILHRVHGRNATPVRLWRHWPRRIAAHLTLPAHRRLSATVALFYDTFEDSLDPEKRATVEQLLGLHRASWLPRVRRALELPVFRQTAVDDAVLRLILTLKRF